VPRAFKLTQRTVEAARCPPAKKDILLFDAETRGFGLRVTAAGSKTFIAQYHTTTGNRRVPLGTFGVLTVEQARQMARAVLGAAAKGEDPFADRKARDTAARRAKTEGEFTFSRLVDAWAEARKADRRASYIREAVACLKRNLPEWQGRPASTISLADAITALDDVKETKGIVAANRTLAYARAAFGWCVNRQRLAFNPLKGIERPGREIARDRVLTLHELGAVWRGSEALSPTPRGFVRVLMLTLQRRDEVASMRWTELDSFKNPTIWTLPAERAKNGKAHIIHLSEPVLAILDALPRLGGNPFVFASRRDKPVGGFGYMKNRIEAAMSTAPIGDWRFHDFRRAGVTALAGMGFPPHICDRLLNHVTGSIQGVAAVYQRQQFLAERKAALEAWAKCVFGAAEQRAPEPNIIPLVRAG
jgi:integrase